MISKAVWIAFSSARIQFPLGLIKLWNPYRRNVWVFLAVPDLGRFRIEFRNYFWIVPRGSKSRLRPPEEAPRAAQERPKSGQESPQSAKNWPKRGPRGPKRERKDNEGRASEAGGRKESEKRTRAVQSEAGGHGLSQGCAFRSLAAQVLRHTRLFLVCFRFLFLFLFLKKCFKSVKINFFIFLKCYWTKSN